MIPTRGRCLAMTISAIALAGALLMAGMPGTVLLALTPGLLCLALGFALGHGDPRGVGEALDVAAISKAPLVRPAAGPGIGRAG